MKVDLFLLALRPDERNEDGEVEKKKENVFDQQQ
jgi:hypothetical protein